MVSLPRATNPRAHALLLLVLLIVLVFRPAAVGAQCEMLESGGYELRSVSDDLNANCCNGVPVPGSGHRRALQGSPAEACELRLCTAACAALFVPLFERCPTQMQACHCPPLRVHALASSVSARSAARMFCLFIRVLAAHSGTPEVCTFPLTLNFSPPVLAAQYTVHSVSGNA